MKLIVLIIMGNKNNFITNHDKYIKNIHFSYIDESAARMVAFTTILLTFFSHFSRIPIKHQHKRKREL